MPVFEYDNEKLQEIPIVLLRSDVMNDVISKRPSFLARWALLFFLFILILLVCATWFIQYPEVILTRSTIIAQDIPKEIVVRQGGRIAKLLVQNEDSVMPGTILGYLESTASPEQVLFLQQKIDSVNHILQQDQVHLLDMILSNEITQLGELQSAYQDFTAAFQKYRSYILDGFYIQKLLILNEDLVFLAKNKDNILQQKHLIEKDLKLSEETYEMNEKMYREKIISKLEDKSEQSKLVNKKLNIPQIEAQLLTNENQLREKRKEIAELEFEISQQQKIFEQQTRTFHSQIQNWIKDYVLTSTIEGRVSYNFPVQDNSFFPSNTILGYVTPNLSRYYAKTNLPQNNFGKLAKGQSVQLRIDAYPFAEYGLVNGKLDYISEIASDSGYLAFIKLPNGLVTNQAKTLQFRNGLKADARVITKDIRLFDRIFYDLMKMINK